MMNYYCGDVMVRGAYPFFAKRLWDADGVTLDITEQDKSDLLAGKVDFIVSAIIPPAVLLPIKMWKWMEQEI